MSVNYKVDLHQTGTPYPHYWEFCVGSCHAATLLRADVQEHIRKAHEDIGFRYIRFHGLFDDDMSVYFTPMIGQPITSFYNIDLIFDFLLDIGMKPFIELGFMPSVLASTDQTTFHYKGYSSMPKDEGAWQQLIRDFARHLIDRYGLSEVSTWFFEVWNEPNLRFFFDGTQEDYFHLYELTARALKEVDPCLKVGGPATSVNAWIIPFVNFCKDNDVPVDFVSTHHYPSDDPLGSFGMNGPGFKAPSMSPDGMKDLSPEEIQKIVERFTKPRENKNPREILSLMTKKAKEEAGDLPLYYTEWNGSHDFDNNYQAALIAQTLSYNHDLVEGYSYWTVSDIFEEMGMKPGPFKNEFGIQTNHGVPKPSYRIFEALHQAGAIRLDVPSKDQNVEVLALTTGDEATIFVYNHDLDRRSVKQEEVELTISGATDVWKGVIDETHTAPVKCWEAMGSPAYLNKEQVATLKEASVLRYEKVCGEAAEDGCKFTFTAEPESVTIFKCRVK